MYVLADYVKQEGSSIPGAREEIEAVTLGNEQTAYGAFNQAEVSDTVINEIRAYSHSDQSLRWTAGLFRLVESFSWASQEIHHGWWGDCDWFQPGTVCGWLKGLNGENLNDDSEVTSTAAYLDGVYDLNDTTRLIAGVCWAIIMDPLMRTIFSTPCGRALFKHGAEHEVRQAFSNEN